MTGAPALQEGIPFVVSGPSGAGKTSILQRALVEDARLGFSVSHTTRRSRKGEREGDDYFFVDEVRFRGMIERGDFLEWAEYQGNLYGTSREAVESVTRRGMDVILEVEVQGARQLRAQLKQAVFVFVLPPSLAALEARLRSRGSDAEEAVRRRLARAREEIREAVSMYDYLIVNDDLPRATADLHHVIGASRLERRRVVSLLRNRFDFG